MNKREFIFLYDAKDCVPNGDPFTGEQRYDEDVQMALVSDVRLKRYIRDFIDLNFEDETIFYSEKGAKETTGTRAIQLADNKKTIKKDDKNKEVYDEVKNLEKLKTKCIDVRLFGTVVAGKTGQYNTQATGAVQFKLFNRTLNKVFLPTTQNTTIMKSGEDKTQGSMATFSYLPYGLFSCVGYFNPTTAVENLINKDLKDLEKMKIALWNEINTKNTRSKTGQQSRLFIDIEYNDDYYKIPDIEYSISLKDEKKFKYRKFDDIKSDLDFSKLECFLNKSEDLIKSVSIYVDSFSFEKDFLQLDDKLKEKVTYFTIKGKQIEELK